MTASIRAHAPAAAPATAQVIPAAGIAAALLAGLALLFVAGISQAAVLHDAAHDQRHAITFPCH